MPASGRTEAIATGDSPELFRPADLPRVLAQLGRAGGSGGALPAAVERRAASRADGTAAGRSFDRLEVEIGCGNGHFLVEYCLEHPAALFLGVEIKKKRCVKAQKKITNHRLANAIAIHGSGEEVLKRLPPASVDAFHLYFPDPWPKSKHRRRRFLRRENLELLSDRLRSNGVLFFATDFFDYYLHTKVLIILQPELKLSPVRPSDSVFRSVFARRFLDAGKPVRMLAARKEGLADDQMPDE